MTNGCLHSSDLEVAIPPSDPLIVKHFSANAHYAAGNYPVERAILPAPGQTGFREEAYPSSLRLL
jgi:hypothetical protein